MLIYIMELKEIGHNIQIKEFLVKITDAMLLKFNTSENKNKIAHCQVMEISY